MFGGKEQERHFVRTDVSRTEQALSWGVLGVLAAVAAFVVVEGGNVDPGLFSATVDTSAGPAPEEPLVDAAATPVQPPEAVAPDPFAKATPDGWSSFGGIETFTPGTLYEKINGRAEQYLAYDVDGLKCASYAEPGGAYVDVYLYDMGTSLNAFGIYSVERSPDGAPLDLGDRSYRSGTGTFFWQGRHYGQVIGSAESGAVGDAVNHIARTLSSTLAGADELPWGLRLLPEADRIAGSTQYYRRDALGLDFLPPTFLARYAKAAGPVTLFVARADSPAAAEDALAAYRDYAGMFGQTPTADDGVWVCDLGGIYDAVFAQGWYVAGVTAGPGPDAAAGRARDLRSHLQDAP